MVAASYTTVLGDSMENVIVWLVVTLVGSFGGSYLGAYFKKKGENLATHEDIDKLVEQVSAVTKTTKEIEAKISDEVWDRQRRWELKRDVLLDAMKKLGVLPEHLVSLQNVYRDFGTGPSGWRVDETQAREALKWQRAAGDFDAALFLAELVCEPQLVHAMREFSLIGRRTAETVMKEGHLSHPGVSEEWSREWSRELMAKFNSATEAARKELGIAGTVFSHLTGAPLPF
jgi:hypothetical protein